MKKKASHLKLKSETYFSELCSPKLKVFKLFNLIKFASSNSKLTLISSSLM